MLAEFNELGNCDKDYWQCAFLDVRLVNFST